MNADDAINAVEESNLNVEEPASKKISINADDHHVDTQKDEPAYVAGSPNADM
jgi:hypothetical protein